MRDLIDKHEAYGRAMLADLTGRDGPAKAPAEPQDAQVGVLRSTVQAGAGNAVQQARSAKREP